MSGVLKSVGKVFKKVVKSKIFKIAAIAAAVYFTAGIGLAAAGSEFAAALPGIQGVGGALGILGEGAGAAGTLASTAGLGAEEIGMGAADAVGAGGGGSAGIVKNVASAAKTGSSFLPTNDAGPEQLAGPGYNGTPGINPNGGGTGPGKPGGFLGLNDNGQKVLFESLAGGAKAVIGGLAAKSNADAYIQNQQDERDWHDKNRQTVDLSAVYHPKYKTPGIIEAAKQGG